MYLFIYYAQGDRQYKIIGGWDVVDAVKNFHEEFCTTDNVPHVSGDVFGLMVKGLIYQDAVKAFNELYPWRKIVSIYKNLEEVQLDMIEGEEA